MFKLSKLYFPKKKIKKICFQKTMGYHLLICGGLKQLTITNSTIIPRVSFIYLLIYLFIYLFRDAQNVCAVTKGGTVLNRQQLR